MVKGKKGKKPKPRSEAPRAERRDGGGGGIAKRKHAHADGAKGQQRAALVQRLQAEAPAKPKSESGAEKRRKKRAAKSAVLGAVDGMRASLEDLLSEGERRAAAAAPSSGGSLSSKKRQKLVAEETEHMRAVLAHPAFIADPFAALQEHLRNTVAPRSTSGKKDKKGPQRKDKAR